MLVNKSAPSLIKYMGSKKKLLDFVISGINSVLLDGPVCDLFAGSNSLAGALNNQVEMIVNDIQSYSKIYTHTYLYNKKSEVSQNKIDEFFLLIQNKINEKKNKLNDYSFVYPKNITIDEFVSLEKEQQNLINHSFNFEYHLFIKNYSGTYWSFNQCIEIDSIREIADLYKNQYEFYLILSSLMFAMAYTSQSTGHYAQYRDATSQKSMEDILTYREKSVYSFFVKKVIELSQSLEDNEYNYKATSLDFRDCLKEIPERTTVYADPPYCFVHYSRFYHVIETLVRYDYPTVAYKGRYREDRHQSPFCIKTQVKKAFKDMFDLINIKNSSLVLSYSNTGMVTLEEILTLANESFLENYQIKVLSEDYSHSTMGRKDDKSREVQELLILVKKIN